MGVDNGDPDPADSWPLLVREVLERLKRRADRKVATALAVALDLSRGYSPAEIRERHALTPADYSEAARWAREELAAMRDQDAVLA